MTLDLDAPLAEFFGDDRFEPGIGYLALGNLVWSPIHAKLKIGGGIVHADFMFVRRRRPACSTTPSRASRSTPASRSTCSSRACMTFRFDARDLMAVQEIAGETRYTNNIVATAGLALWIPTGPMKRALDPRLRVLRRRRLARADDKQVAATDEKAGDEADDADEAAVGARPQMCIDQEIADRLAIKRKRRGAVDRLFVKQAATSSPPAAATTRAICSRARTSSAARTRIT